MNISDNMKRSCIYSKYKQERENARLLKRLKKEKLLFKVSELMIKKNIEVQQNVRVSLPIKHFINAQNKKCKLVNNAVLMEKKNYVAELKVPKLVIKMKASAESKDITKTLRQIRRNKSNVLTTEQNKNTDESDNTTSKKQILRDLSVVLSKEVKDSSTTEQNKNTDESDNTASKKQILRDLSVVLSKEVKDSSTTEQNKNTDESDNTASKKQILRDLSVVLSKEVKDSSKHLKSSLEGGTNKSIDQSTQCSESKDTLKESMYVITRAEFEKYVKLRQSGILKNLGGSDDQNFNNCKRTTQLLPAEQEIIDLDPDIDTDKLNQERLKLALNHSNANKTILRALQHQITNRTSGEIIEVPRPKRAGTPFPFVNRNVASATAHVNSPANVFVSTSNTTPAYMRSSVATTLSNSQSMTLLVHNDQQAKDTYNSHDEIRNDAKKADQGNDRPNELNLNTLAETANSLNKLILPPVVAALRKDLQLRQNQLAQRQLEKAEELQSHKHTMHLSQLLPPKLQKQQTLPGQLQPPQSKQCLSQQPQLLQMRPPYSEPANQQQLQMPLQEPQSQQVQPQNLQLTQLPILQPSSLQQLQTLQPQPKQLQELQPRYLQSKQLQLSMKPQPTQLNPLQTQLPLQQPPPLPPPQLQPSQMQLLHQPPYTQTTQMPHSQWPSVYGAQQWQPNFYHNQQQEYTQQNGQYIQRQHNYSNIYGTQNQKANKANRGNSYLHLGDPRKPPQSRPTVRARSSYSRMMSYEGNYQNEQNTHPNYFPQQMHFNNPNLYW